MNVDLITGIPGQTEEMVRSDVTSALDFGADHFSVYSLTVEEHTALKQALDADVRRMPPPERQDGLWFAARDAIVAAGFEWYEISNFALPGRRSEHNLGYWRLEPYLGLGPGGVSIFAAAGPALAAACPTRLADGARLDPAEASRAAAAP